MIPTAYASMISTSSLSDKRRRFAGLLQLGANLHSGGARPSISPSGPGEGTGGCLRIRGFDGCSAAGWVDGVTGDAIVDLNLVSRWGFTTQTFLGIGRRIVSMTRSSLGD